MKECGRPAEAGQRVEAFSESASTRAGLRRRWTPRPPGIEIPGVGQAGLPTLTPNTPHPRLPTSHAPLLDHRRGHPPGGDPAGRGLQRSALVRGRPRARLRAQLATRRRTPTPSASPGPAYPFTLLDGIARRAAAADPRLAATSSTACPTSAPTAGRWSASTPGFSRRCAAAITAGASLTTAVSSRCRSSRARRGSPRRRTTCAQGARSEPGGSWCSPRSTPPFRSPSCWPRWTRGSPGCRSHEAVFDPARSRDYLVQRQLGALLRQLPGGVPHPLRPRRAGRRARLRRVPHRALPLGQPAGGGGGAAARTSSICPPLIARLRPEDRRPTTSGSSPTRC